MESQRLYTCARCHALVVICAACDRGNFYCGRICSARSRREKQRASNRRYQATERGRQLHAARAARYRRRLAGHSGVTEQGSQPSRRDMATPVADHQNP
jgi:hypothetical protein